MSWDGAVTIKLEVTPGNTDQTLCEIGFSRHSPSVIWRGCDVFNTFTHFVRSATQLDSAPLSGFGIILLRDFGLTISGFDGPVEDRAITVFPKGRWDNNLDGMVPFTVV